MRTGLRLGRIRRLVHLWRETIASAADALRRRALPPLVGVRERLGLVGVSAATAADPGDAASARGDRARAPAARRTGTESESEGPRAEREAAPAESASTPEAPAPRDLASQAAAQLQHVALVVPPGPGAAEPARPAPAPPREPADIPWSYGKDRVTAAAVDPNRLYVYWEVTDDALARARAALGDAGGDAWLDLRVYDTTGILFDGTNAHHYFDHGLDRSERQWFFDIGRPTSSAFVEVGLRAREGAFARIARSGRVDFPRAEPAPWSDPEWMTVVASTGEAQLAGRGLRAPGGVGPAPGAAAPADGGFAGAPQAFLPIPLWVIRDAAGHATWVRELSGSAWERVEWSESHGEHWFELLGRVEWEGPRTFTTWEAGPFPYPVELQEPTREEWEGRSIAYRAGGVTRVVHGPWQVVIRNLGAHGSRSVLARWEMYRSWVAEGGREVRAGPVPRPVPVGASEALAGGSERAWLSGSELRLGGASELWRIGASELQYAGGSERLYSGASERRARGASEQRLGGASEWLLRGGSEQVRRGASERLHQGASERAWGGASEETGASERRLGASEGRLAEPPGGGYPRTE